MKKEKKISPPAWAVQILNWYCRPELLEDLHGDLHEYFERNLNTKGAFRARLIYVIDVLKFFRIYTLRKPQFLNLFIDWIMISSYLKTTQRSMLRNKLFSFINVVGLAMSMSVGLLVISLLSDLFSYDQFHEKRNRIYRVITSHQFNGQPVHHLASTSILAGKKIRESAAGAEEVTILRSGFQASAQFEDRFIPLSALWADEKFFSVFTFPLVQGNVNSALREPYSVVLTEQSARKLFGEKNALGKTVQLGSHDYFVTGILKDIPPFSHLQFQALISFSTLLPEEKTNADFLKWENVWQNYVYVLLPENNQVQALQANISKICDQENLLAGNQKIFLTLQPMKEFVLGSPLANSIGPKMPVEVVWVLGALACIILISACFNYTNLSIARSLKRAREVGIRKVVGARKRQVVIQFITEAVVISLCALFFSFLIFLLLRPSILSLAPQLSRVVAFSLTPALIGYFIGLAVIVGLIAGVLPALFFSRVNAIQVLKNVIVLKVFGQINLRKTLITVQYAFSFIFITAAIIIQQQHHHFLTLDLGFDTENIVNIHLQGNKADLLIKELKEIPEVSEVSKSLMVTTVGSKYGNQMRYGTDSTEVYYNIVDEYYVPLHRHELVAGRNFIAQSAKESGEILVNMQVLRQLNMGEPHHALGEVVTMKGKRYEIVGVMKDFNYSNPKLGGRDEPVAFRYSGESANFVNVKIASGDWQSALVRMEEVWRKIDHVNPLNATLYKDQIQQTYNDLSILAKVISFLSLLTISIASMGLFGMVVYTTQARLKEVSIRKIMGANETGLIMLLSKGFVFLLFLSSAVALPLTYLFFEEIIFTNVPYHAPISIARLAGGAMVIITIAFLTIGSQTLKAARTNPADILKNE